MVCVCGGGGGGGQQAAISRCKHRRREGLVRRSGGPSTNLRAGPTTRVQHSTLTGSVLHTANAYNSTMLVTRASASPHRHRNHGVGSRDGKGVHETQRWHVKAAVAVHIHNHGSCGSETSRQVRGGKAAGAIVDEQAASAQRADGSNQHVRIAVVVQVWQQGETSGERSIQRRRQPPIALTDHNSHELTPRDDVQPAENGDSHHPPPSPTPPHLSASGRSTTDGEDTFEHKSGTTDTPLLLLHATRSKRMLPSRLPSAMEVTLASPGTCQGGLVTAVPVGDKGTTNTLPEAATTSAIPVEQSQAPAAANAAEMLPNDAKAAVTVGKAVKLTPFPLQPRAGTIETRRGKHGHTGARAHEQMSTAFRATELLLPDLKQLNTRHTRRLRKG